MSKEYHLDEADAVPVYVGRATIAWNTVSHAVYDLFETLSGLDEEVAKTIFFTIASDRSQRDIVSGLVESALGPINPKLAKEVQAEIAKINKIAGKRNDVQHVVYLDSLSPSDVSQLHERGHLKGKKGTDLLHSIHAVSSDALDLALALTTLNGRVWKALRGRTKPSAPNAMPSDRTRSTGAEVASRDEYGLLGLLATSPRSSESDQD